jgi:hypothetical protein
LIVIADLFFPLFGMPRLPHCFEHCQLVGREFVLAAAIARKARATLPSRCEFSITVFDRKCAIGAGTQKNKPLILGEAFASLTPVVSTAAEIPRKRDLLTASRFTTPPGQRKPPNQAL